MRRETFLEKSFRNRGEKSVDIGGYDAGGVVGFAPGC